jgi:hypothetical protein
MKTIRFFIYTLIAGILLNACYLIGKKDDNLPVPHANFSIETLDLYHFKVTLLTPNTLDHTFRYANGDSSKSVVDTVYYPFQGTYNITLQVVTAKGTSSAIKQVTVTSDDQGNPDLSDPVINLLTGGINDADGKTWVLDTSAYSGGVGPKETLTPDWYNFITGYHGPVWDNGMAQNSFTFKLRQYQYIPKNNKVTAHFAYANRYFGTNQPMYADTALVDPNHKQAPFIIKNAGTGVGTGYTIDIANGSYLGYFEKRFHYEIVSITNNTLYVRNYFNDDAYADPANDVGVRYFTFIAQP